MGDKYDTGDVLEAPSYSDEKLGTLEALKFIIVRLIALKPNYWREKIEGTSDNFAIIAFSTIQDQIAMLKTIQKLLIKFIVPPAEILDDLPVLVGLSLADELNKYPTKKENAYKLINEFKNKHQGIPYIITLILSPLDGKPNFDISLVTLPINPTPKERVATIMKNEKYEKLAKNNPLLDTCFTVFNSVPDEFLDGLSKSMAKTRIEGKNHKCANCGKEGVTKRCGGCGITYYCNAECQVKNWQEKHKRVCKRLATYSLILTENT